MGVLKQIQHKSSLDRSKSIKGSVASDALKTVTSWNVSESNGYREKSNHRYQRELHQIAHA